MTDVRAPAHNGCSTPCTAPYAWASGVMPGLAQTDDRTFVVAIQEMNRAIVNPVFLLSFLGAPVIGVVGAVVVDGDARWLGGGLGGAGDGDHRDHHHRQHSRSTTRSTRRASPGARSPTSVRCAARSSRAGVRANNAMRAVTSTLATAGFAWAALVSEAGPRPAGLRARRPRARRRNFQTSIVQKSRSQTAVTPTPSTQARPPLVIAPRTEPDRSAVTPAGTSQASRPTGVGQHLNATTGRACPRGWSRAARPVPRNTPLTMSAAPANARTAQPARSTASQASAERSRRTPPRRARIARPWWCTRAVQPLSAVARSTPTVSAE